MIVAALIRHTSRRVARPAFWISIAESTFLVNLLSPLWLSWYPTTSLDKTLDMASEASLDRNLDMAPAVSRDMGLSNDLSIGFEVLSLDCTHAQLLQQWNVDMPFREAAAIARKAVKTPCIGIDSIKDTRTRTTGQSLGN